MTACWRILTAITQRFSNQMIKVGPLKSEAQGLDLSASIVCDKLLRAVGSSIRTCFSAILASFFATFSWPEYGTQYHTSSEMGLCSVIGVDMGGCGMELSWVVQWLSFGMALVFFDKCSAFGELILR
jgi:hypothetical protein